jgi:Na+/phosphate symporter
MTAKSIFNPHYYFVSILEIKDAKEKRPLFVVFKQNTVGLAQQIKAKDDNVGDLYQAIKFYLIKFVQRDLDQKEITNRGINYELLLKK